MCRLNPLCNCSASTTVAYRPCTALTHHILWLSSALSTKCAVLIHYATVVLERPHRLAAGLLVGQRRSIRLTIPQAWKWKSEHRAGCCPGALEARQSPWLCGFLFKQKKKPTQNF